MAVASRPETKPKTTPRPALVNPRADPWLVGGLGIIAWLLLSLPRVGGPEMPAIVSGPVYWILIALTGTHFGASYHLAYGQGRAVARQRWFAMIVVPASLAVLTLAAFVAVLTGGDGFADWLVRALLTVVFTATGWHYVKQSYGVARLGASLRGLRVDRRASSLLRYGLYPLWLVDALQIWFQPSTATVEREGGGFEIAPSLLVRLVDAAAVISAVMLVAVFGYLLRTWRQLPAMMWTPYVVGYLWFLFPPNYTSLIVVLSAIHGLQYLACAHRAELVWGIERNAGAPAQWWLAVFGGAFATGMLLVYWLPGFLTATAGDTALGTLPATMLFISFNLHHYAVDASIWRSRDDHIRRIVSGPDPATVANN